MSDKVDYRALYQLSDGGTGGVTGAAPPAQQRRTVDDPMEATGIISPAAIAQAVHMSQHQAGPAHQAPPTNGHAQQRPPTNGHAPATAAEGQAAAQVWGAEPGAAVPDFGVARRPQANSGVRGRINRILGTRLPPTEAEAAYDAERRSIQAPVPTIKWIGVLHAKGGVGSSSVVQMLGNTLTDQRREPAYAIDADYGGSLLGRTLDASGTNSAKSTWTLHRWNPKGHEHFGSMFTRTPQGLMVIGNPKDTNDESMSPEAFVEVLNRFPKEGSLRLIDMPHWDSPLFVPLLRGLSSIVLVTTPEQDSVKASLRLRDAIRDDLKLPALVSSMVVVVNHRSPADPLIDENKLSNYFQAGDDRGAASGLKRVLYTRYDKHLAEGGPVDYTLVDADTRKRYVTIAAATVARLTA